GQQAGGARETSFLPRDNPQSEIDSKEDILKAFKLFVDRDSGRIAFEHLKQVAAEIGQELTDEELQEMIHEADLDGDGEVTEQDFLKVMKRRDY
uniref:EF-hand domain-containing protein n=1 Tax=Laticauda laticaudata TaxID=8630 RepID=A0A8C5SWQ7_LATLA